MNVLLGLTGSVATQLAPKLIQSLKDSGHNVQVILTSSAAKFTNVSGLMDEDEWTTYETKKTVLHIDLVKWADVLLIAPCTYNTLNKLANGIADNLLSNVWAAWPHFDKDKYAVVAYAMNSQMYDNCILKRFQFEKDNLYTIIVPPQYKELFCGDRGIGALADISNIINTVNKLPYWHFPINQHIKYVPIDNHPGSFGYKRHGYYHSGVDIYVDKDPDVYAVKSGVVIGYGQFTGKNLGTQWWNDTEYLSVMTNEGIVIYGEIEVLPHLKKPNAIIHKGEKLGKVIPVIKDGSEPNNPPPYWSKSMLHLELYQYPALPLNGQKPELPPLEWITERPPGLLDPTSYLLFAK